MEKVSNPTRPFALLRFSTLLKPANCSISPFSFLILKYTKDNLQRIFKAVFESKIFITLRKPSDKPQKIFPKASALDIYNDRSDINYYNLI